MLVSRGSTGARRERRRAKKNDIIQAAARLFAEKGYHRTTTREIAHAADVAEGTLYNYFENKEDLLFQIVTCLAESFRLSERLVEGIQGDAYQALLSLLGERIDWIRRNRNMLQVVYSEILVNTPLRDRYYRQVYLPSIKLLEDHLEMRSNSGQIRPIDIQLSARFLGGLSIGLFMLDSLGDEALENRWGEITGVIGDIIFHGLDRGMN
jgi:AcrR family transcriptional regulator